jgi:hypothetical protein
MASNIVEAPNLFMSWGSLKSTGIINTALARINWADKTGDGSLPSDADFAPDPGSIISSAELILRASSDTASDQLSLFDTQLSMLEFDPNGRWEIEAHIGSSFMHGLQGFGFEAFGSPGPGPIDGTGNKPASGSVTLQMGRTPLTGANRVGNSFQVGAGGTTLTAVTFWLGRFGSFSVGENITATIYRCVEDDGSNDAPDPTLGPVGASSGELGVSTLPITPAQKSLLWVVSPPVLSEGRYVAMIERVNWGAGGDRYVKVLLAPASRAPAGDQNSHACAVSTATSRAAPNSFVGPGFATGTGYISGYDFPHTHASDGSVLAGTVRDAAPNSPTTVWPAPRAGPFAVATPAFVTPGVEFSMDVTALIQAYIDRPEYASEKISPHPIGFALAFDEIDADKEREADLFRLKISWNPSAVCTAGDLSMADTATGKFNMADLSTGELDMADQSSGKLNTAEAASGSLDIVASTTGSLDICPEGT